jgi:serine/threonine protein kinase
MEPLMRDVLTAAGVAIEPDVGVGTAWKNWLNVDSEVSMEQTAPLGASVYEAFASLCIFAWRDVLHLSNDIKHATLEDQVEAVRVTSWLRNIMDFHVHDQASFSSLLLQSTCHHQQQEELLDALYHHVASLPYLQQQIHYRAQALRQETTHAKTHSVLSRLEHYQETQGISERLLMELDQHVMKLEYILGEWYAVGSMQLRKLCRCNLGKVWHDFVKTAHGAPCTKRIENTSATGIHMTLCVLYRILQGSTKTTPAHRHLLFHQLLPLHQPSSMVLWRDQTCLLELYHEPLVQCTAILLKRQPDWIPPAIESLIQPNVWPNSGNTPKVVLILHEIDMYIGLVASAATSSSEWQTLENVAIFRALLRKLAICIASDNSRMSERSLQFFRNVHFCQLVFDDYDDSMTILLPALVRGSDDVPWNPTVCKMTHTVLVQCQSHNEQKFAAAAQRVFGNNHDIAVNVSCVPRPKNDTTVSMQVEQPTMKETTTAATTATTMPPPSSSRFSLKAGMGDWRPPPSGRHHSMLPPKSRPFAKTPPLTITGVAPWAGTLQSAPPSTITGVAPWAGESMFGHKRNAGEAQLSEKSPPPHPAPIAEEEEEEVGLKRVLQYMSQLKPAEDGSGDDDDGTSPWAKAQMSETPTLLPTLKFHDLVFGRDLGSGAFGVVKYARQIDKSTTRSHWAEYAVKIISTQRIQEMGYESSVQREIATLRVMSHPCIARLISSFRFGDGAYLVLEYASGGDLHSLLQKHGSLDQDSTKFVMGEIASALASIHDLGFVYGDLKPENVLITETGHIKLTDFGACRPVTLSAKKLIQPSGQHLLNELRDGDWKEKPNTQEDDDDVEMKEAGSSQEMEVEDLWIEGTTAYLPPEVVLGQVPTTAADAWALGCVMYQCLSGRPPLLDNDEHATKHKIVTFHMENDNNNDDDDDASSDPLFRDAHSADITPEARALIRKLLSRENRPSMVQVAQDDFFSGTDIFSLHRQPAVPLDVGTVAPVEDAQWSRRQYSSIWAPQPKAYDISIPQPMHLANPLLLPSKAPIPEGNEANCFFSWSRQVS